MTEVNEMKAEPVAAAPKGENKPLERAELHSVNGKPHKVMRCLCVDGVRRNATLSPNKKSEEGHLSGMVRVKDKKVYGFVLQMDDDYKFVASKEAKNASLLPS